MKISSLLMIILSYFCMIHFALTFRQKPIYLMNKKSSYKMTSNSLEGEQSRESLKTKLFSLAAAVDRGFGAKSFERDEILSIVDELKNMSPNASPTMGLYPNNTVEQPAPIEGVWKMVYTTAFDVLTLNASPLTIVQSIYQVINKDGTSLNVIDLAPRFEALLPVGLPQGLGRSTLRLKVKTFAQARRSNRVGLNFLGASARPLTALGIDATALPALGFNFPQLNLFGGSENSNRDDSPGFFDILYLDENCLIISQNEPGGSF